jgi:hypothetical protein
MRHEGQTLRGKNYTHSSFCSLEQDAMYMWRYWELPLELYLKFQWPYSSGWDEIKPRELRA